MTSTTAQSTADTTCLAPGCGHLAGEHWPHGTAIYPCRAPGCECTGFVPPPVPKTRPQTGDDLVRDLHGMGVTERIQLLDWLARNRTGMLRSGMRDWKATRPLRPVVPSGIAARKSETRYPPPGE